MSTQPQLPGHPHPPPHRSVMTAGDWAEDIAIGVMLLSAVAVLAVVLALLIFL
jgi:hypothetical protein